MRQRGVLFADRPAGLSALQGLGLTLGQAKWLAGLDATERDLLTPSPEAVDIARESGLSVGALVGVLAAQADVTIPADWSTLA